MSGGGLICLVVGGYVWGWVCSGGGMGMPGGWVCPGDEYPPSEDSLLYRHLVVGTEADGTHPTGVHSCLFL